MTASNWGLLTFSGDAAIAAVSHRSVPHREAAEKLLSRVPFF
jgi:hypothetical protein